MPCLVPDLRNEHLPKDFKGPRKVPNYIADLTHEAWIESYEMAMEFLILADQRYMMTAQLLMILLHH